MFLRRVVLSSLIAAGSALAAQSVAVSGFVGNWDLKPLSGVQVKLGRSGLSGTTGSDGTWSLNGSVDVGIASRPATRSLGAGHLLLENGRLSVRFG
ncbi:MAG: hypothetical protein RL318_748, partial [Fibrobacterota bacterium]